MNNKSLHRNVIPATVLAAASVTVSQVERATWGRGIRFYITVSAATAGGGTDTVFLCGGIPPVGGTALPTPIPIVGFAGANILAVAGVYVADFYPGAWLPPTIAAGGKLLGAAGIELPMNWAVQVTMGAGNAATITVDAEMMP